MSESRGHFIDGQWTNGEGEPLVSHDPSTGEPCWIGHAASVDHIDRAIESARRAQPAWAAWPLQQRIEIVQAFGKQLETNRDALAELISIETGKPLWESHTEVAAMIGKIPLSIAALNERRGDWCGQLGEVDGSIVYRPIGVLCVFGPFNFPGHIANGHITPALLAGNAVVFKPSQFTPAVAQLTVELWQAAGLPNGVLNLLQGARHTGEALSAHVGHDGVLFTGSYRTAQAIARTLADRPEKMLAFELGGNNALIVHHVADVKAAAYGAVQSCFITSGQRCTCARRVIVTDGPHADAFVDAFVAMTQRLRIGRYTDTPQPFMGPVIASDAADRLMQTQRDLIHAGAKPLLSMTRPDACGAFLTPGILDATQLIEQRDEECFGPMTQIIRVDNLDSAIARANATRYGLVAGLFSDDADVFKYAHQKLRAGLINFNRPTTGASSKLPFGGVGRSGNHRPSGFFAVDYCTDPVASMSNHHLTLPDEPSPGVEI